MSKIKIATPENARGGRDRKRHDASVSSEKHQSTETGKMRLTVMRSPQRAHDTYMWKRKPTQRDETVIHDVKVRKQRRDVRHGVVIQGTYER